MRSKMRVRWVVILTVLWLVSGAIQTSSAEDFYYIRGFFTDEDGTPLARGTAVWADFGDSTYHVGDSGIVGIKIRQEPVQCINFHLVDVTYLDYKYCCDGCLEEAFQEVEKGSFQYGDTIATIEKNFVLARDSVSGSVHFGPGINGVPAGVKVRMHWYQNFELSTQGDAEERISLDDLGVVSLSPIATSGQFHLPLNRISAMGTFPKIEIKWNYNSDIQSDFMVSYSASWPWQDPMEWEQTNDYQFSKQDTLQATLYKKSEGYALLAADILGITTIQHFPHSFHMKATNTSTGEFYPSRYHRSCCGIKIAVPPGEYMVQVEAETDIDWGRYWNSELFTVAAGDRAKIVFHTTEKSSWSSVHNETTTIGSSVRTPVGFPSGETLLSIYSLDGKVLPEEPRKGSMVPWTGFWEKVR